MSDKVKKIVDKREFVRHFSRYLKLPGVYCLTGRDGNVEVEVGSVGKTLVRQEVPKDALGATWSNEVTGTAVGVARSTGTAVDPLKRPAKGSAERSIGFHHCGCPKGASYLCSKHSRL